jgi:hypothetical protein
MIIEKILEQPSTVVTLEDRWRSLEALDMSMEVFSNSSSSKKWSAFAADKLAYLLYPNMCRTLGDAYRAFDYVESVDSFGRMERLAIRSLGSFAMFMVAREY